MDKAAIMLVGGLNLSQSLWCLSEGLLRAGYSVDYLPAVGKDMEHGGRKITPDSVYEEIAARLSRGRDVLIWWQPSQADPERVRQLRERFPKVRFCAQSLDDPFVLDLSPEPLMGFEYVVTCCEGSFRTYEARGVRPILGYPPVDRDLHGKAEPTAEEACDLSFIATNTYPKCKYPYVISDRRSMLLALAGVGKIHLYGYWDEKPQGWGGDRLPLPPSWKSCFRGWRRYDVQVPGVYAASRINLNSHVRPDGWKYLNERVTTCMASGGFMLCDAVSGIESIFRADEEIVLWRTLQELRDKAVYWLANEEARRRVAAAGREKALALFDNEKLARRIVERCATGA